MDGIRSIDLEPTSEELEMLHEDEETWVALESEVTSSATSSRRSSFTRGGSDFTSTRKQVQALLPSPAATYSSS
jgi:hypothetical protein